MREFVRFFLCISFALQFGALRPPGNDACECGDVPTVLCIYIDARSTRTSSSNSTLPAPFVILDSRSAHNMLWRARCIQVIALALPATSIDSLLEVFASTDQVAFATQLANKAVE